jgi:SAM-dependent methyltransferase
MIARSTDTNLETYNAPTIAAHYATLDYLTPCERILFGTYIPVGSAVLDLGVGGGRTTAYLAQRAKKYVGLDYAPAMIAACRNRFPGIEFIVGNAANLSAFSDGSFDAVVFAFNGIDYLLPDSVRRECWQHIRRILKPGAVVIFSSHNPRAVLVRVRGNPERLRAIAQKFSAGSPMLDSSLSGLLISSRWTLSLAQSAWATLKRAYSRLPTRIFWQGEGTRVDPSHGGLVTHYWIPHRAITELAGMGFRLKRVLGDDYPKPSHPYATDWYYYVFAKCCGK